MTRPTITTGVLEETPTGHLVEFRYDDGANDDVLVCAAHGGRVEPGTGEQALELATRLPNATCWSVLGYDDEHEEFEQWHPPSTAITPDEYPLLSTIADRGFKTVVSLHGLAGDGVLVGGGIDAVVKRRVRDHLDDALPTHVEVVSEGRYAGVHPDNFVNWLAADGSGGLQLEQSPDVRDDESRTVVDVLERLISAGEI